MGLIEVAVRSPFLCLDGLATNGVEMRESSLFCAV